MQKLAIKIFEKPEEAPIYSKQDFTSVLLNEAVVVKNGTIEGNPTIDLVLTDAEGKSYVAMVTGRLLKGLANAIEIKEDSKPIPCGDNL